ncbi:unnamed protein product [Closterium sp. NIES-65]|nr:unnamed protein product [Closterium sp. NIES-65]
MLRSRTRFAYRNISSTAITCPPDYSSCVVPQTNSSAFCSECGSFCTTCDKPPPASFSTVSADTLPVASANTLPVANANTLPVANANTLPVASANTLPVASANTLPIASANTLPIASANTLPITSANTLPVASANTLPIASANTLPVASANTLPIASANTLPIASANTLPVASANTLPIASAKPLSTSSNVISHFGVVTLVVITARKAVHVTQENQINLKQWVAPLVDSGAVLALKDPHLDAPDDLVLRWARLALSCTAMPAASRPSMNQVLWELVKLKEEASRAHEGHVGEAKSCIDMELGSSIGSSSFTAEMARAEREGGMPSGSST